MIPASKLADFARPPHLNSVFMHLSHFAPGDADRLATLFRALKTKFVKREDQRPVASVSAVMLHVDYADHLIRLSGKRLNHCRQCLWGLLGGRQGGWGNPMLTRLWRRNGGGRERARLIFSGPSPRHCRPGLRQLPPMRPEQEISKRQQDQARKSDRCTNEAFAHDNRRVPTLTGCRK